MYAAKSYVMLTGGPTQYTRMQWRCSGERVAWVAWVALSLGIFVQGRAVEAVYVYI